MIIKFSLSGDGYEDEMIVQGICYSQFLVVKADLQFNRISVETLRNVSIRIS